MSVEKASGTTLGIHIPERKSVMLHGPVLRNVNTQGGPANDVTTTFVPMKADGSRATSRPWATFVANQFLGGMSVFIQVPPAVTNVVWTVGSRPEVRGGHVLV